MMEPADAVLANHQLPHPPRLGKMAPALTAGRGVDHILELGGPDTYDRSIPAIAPGGKIEPIGALTGFASQMQLLTQFMAQHQIHPLIDALFSFEEAPKAYAQLASS